MLKTSNMVYRTLVIGVIILFIGSSITPIISGNIKQVKNNEVLRILCNKLEEIVLIVDQVVDTICGSHWGRIQIKSHMPFGQSFKPLYKCHYGIELYIAESNPGFPLAPIQISLKENNITGSIVPGTNVTLNLTSGSGWRFFEFASPVDLIINQTYVIDISTTTPRWGVNDTSGHCYTRGLFYTNGEPSGMDLYFRTYVLSPYPVANFTYSAEESPVLFNGSSSYDPCGYIVSYEWDFGDGTTGTGEKAYHKYCEVGTYYVTLTVTDDDGLTDNITKCIDVLIADTPPELCIYGPNLGKPDVDYEYVFYVIDPDPDDFYLWVDWGDGETTEWIGPYGSGAPINVSHVWEEKGIYMIKARVRDFCGKSEWAEFEVEIPRTRAINSLFTILIEQYPILVVFLRIMNLLR